MLMMNLQSARGVHVCIKLVRCCCSEWKVLQQCGWVQPIGCLRWRKGPGRGGGSRLKSTLFMGPRHKGFNSERQRRSQNCLLCAGKKKMQPQKVEFPLKDTEYFKSFTLHKALCMSDFQMLHLSSKQSHVWKRKEKVCLFFS